MLLSTFLGLNLGSIFDDNVWNKRHKLLSLFAHDQRFFPERVFWVRIVLKTIRPDEVKVADEVDFRFILVAFEFFGHSPEIHWRFDDWGGFVSFDTIIVRRVLLFE